MEGTQRMANKALVLSFWVWTTVGGNSFQMTFGQHFGTGGSPSGNVVTTIGATPSLAANTWTKVVIPFTSLSVAGMTWGTTPGTDFTTLAFNVGTNATGTFKFWGVKLELGSTPSALAPEDSATELEKCQRFYQVIGLAGIGYQTTGNNFQVSSSFNTIMRAAPTLTISGNSSGNLNTFSTGPIGLGGATGAAIWGVAVATGVVSINTNIIASADF
jgi:hypothetical protein